MSGYTVLPCVEYRNAETRGPLGAKPSMAVPERASDSLELELHGSGESPDVGAENRTQAFRRACTLNCWATSQAPSHHSLSV